MMKINNKSQSHLHILLRNTKRKVKNGFEGKWVTPKEVAKYKKLGWAEAKGYYHEYDDKQRVEDITE